MAQEKTKRLRTCIGCGAKSDKVGLLRIVRTERGVCFDGTGRRAGRGAYACSVKCLESAYASRKLQKALRCGIERSEMEQVMADIAPLSAQAR